MKFYNFFRKMYFFHYKLKTFNNFIGMNEQKVKVIPTDIF